MSMKCFAISKEASVARESARGDGCGACAPWPWNATAGLFTYRVCVATMLLTPKGPHGSKACVCARMHILPLLLPRLLARVLCYR